MCHMTVQVHTGCPRHYDRYPHVTVIDPLSWPRPDPNVARACRDWPDRCTRIIIHTGTLLEPCRRCRLNALQSPLPMDDYLELEEDSDEFYDDTEDELLDELDGLNQQIHDELNQPLDDELNDDDYSEWSQTASVMAALVNNEQNNAPEGDARLEDISEEEKSESEGESEDESEECSETESETWPLDDVLDCTQATLELTSNGLVIVPPSRFPNT